ncbi:hypothetical protein [Streptomyces colonosanans]|uniref:DUF8017 domain-containing protein n=1 Tax=Streptomyces colonosanans TaxID=1428652 RepID=A0A1S2P439_9ACTN|nr:hypothetical protein [Streptomyces colonosanans]OIJ88589.1 hypothetical protein BIV24_21350 [Streptomyces colonosanans]
MWPGQQPPGGEQNPQNQNNPYQQPGYQQPNPYQQPGFQQPNPYQQPGPSQWDGPTVVGSPDGGGGGNRTKLVAIVAATAVVVAAGVTGFLVLGSNKDDNAGGDKNTHAPTSTSQSATPSESSSDDSRGAETEKPTIAGWKVVINPRWGTAFDVPPDWNVESPDTLIGFEKHDAKPGDEPLITMSAPAYLKKEWCTSDEDKDGRVDNTPLAAVGTKGSNGSKSTEQVAVTAVPWWVFGGYTQPDKKSVTFDHKAKPYTTAAGVEGKLAWARSKNTPQKGKCASDGKAITFGFKNSKGDFVAWNLYGATGVKDELPDATIMKILSTVRLHGDPVGS